MPMIEKDYYTTQDLVNQPWFPIRSTITIAKLIENGTLRAVNVSTSPKIKRYRIEKASVEEYLKSSGSNRVEDKPKETKKKKTTKGKAK